MNNSMVAFNLIDKKDNAPVGYKEINCHLLYDVKMNPTRQYRYVAGGHLAYTPQSMIHASVVSCNGVRLDFLIAALNDLYILEGDIQNAYLNASTKEKVYLRWR